MHSASVRTLLPLACWSLAASGCYRLPLTIDANDASGYEDVGIPVIEAIEYTPGGRDVRVRLEQPGYVTVIVLDPERGASVRFRRGQVQSAEAAAGLNRFPLDRLESPLLFTERTAPPQVRTSPRRGNSGLLPRRSREVGQAEPLVPPDPAVRADRLSSLPVTAGSGVVHATHVLVIVSERPLDLVRVGMRLATSSLDPALTAQQVAEPTEGGRWMAAVALLRGQ